MMVSTKLKRRSEILSGDYVSSQNRAKEKYAQVGIDDIAIMPRLAAKKILA